MISKTDKDGYETRYSYAKDGKLVLTEYADETTVRMEYDALRRLVMLEDSLGITRIKRDEHGRIEEVEDPTGRKTDYTWGVHGERKSITTPDRKRTEYQYDNLMRLTSLAVAEYEDGGFGYDVMTKKEIEKTTIRFCLYFYTKEFANIMFIFKKRILLLGFGYFLR